MRNAVQSRPFATWTVVVGVLTRAVRRRSGIDPSVLRLDPVRWETRLRLGWAEIEFVEANHANTAVVLRVVIERSVLRIPVQAAEPSIPRRNPSFGSLPCIR